MRLSLFALAPLALAGCGGGVGGGTPQPPRPALLLSMTAPPLGRGDIFLLDEYGKLRNLTRTADPEEISPSWSPDGRHVVFAAKYETPTGEIRDDLFLIDADGRNRRLLTNTSEREEHDPAWSPDGSRIAYVAERPGPVRDAIWTIRPDGTSARVIGGAGNFPESPTWSPDGRRIAFSSSSRSDDIRIWTVDLDGRNVRRVSRGEIDIEPYWTARGDILFIRGYRVFAVDPASNTETPLPLSALEVSSSPDGEWLTLNESEGIVLTRRDNEHRRVLLRRTGLVYSAPAWRPT